MKKLIAAAIALSCRLAAQDSPPPKNTYHSSGGASAQARLISPEVNSDRTVTFRLRAPEANHISLSFGGLKPITKDAGGIWTPTVGPLEPEICQYTFIVGGVKILDPANPNLKNGRALDASIGRAGVILDNLIAQRKAVPMIIVMPNGDTDGSWAGGSSPQGIELLSQELLTGIIPMVDKTFRVAPGRENRAIAGLSMGGGQAFTIGLKHLDLFAWVGEISSGLVSDANFRLDQHLPGFLDQPGEVNKKLKLLYLSCGTSDPRYQGQLDLIDVLKQHNIKYEWYPTPGVHEWKVWRHALYDFAQRVFLVSLFA